MDNPGATLEDLMKYIKGPDLPTGGKIVGLDTIREAYATGRGIFKMRAKAEIEKISAKKQGIIVTELPYMVGPGKVIEKISEAVKNHKLEGISNVIDLTDRKRGLRIQIDIKNGFNPIAILERLYKVSPLEESFGINNVALVDGAPKTLGLKELLFVWIQHRIEVIRRRSQFRLNARKDRLHLVEGLLIAIVDIDEVIQVIRTSEDTPEASSRLQSVFDLDEIQATYILDLRLRRLTKFSRIELENEKAELLAEIEALEQLLGDDDLLKDEVKRSMHEVATKFGTDRRTTLIETDGSSNSADLSNTGAQLGLLDDGLLAGIPGFSSVNNSAAARGGSKQATQSLEIPDEPCYILQSATGLVVRAKRGAGDDDARSILPTSRAPHDAVSVTLTTSTRAHFGVLTSHGRVVLVNAVDLPEISAGETPAAGISLYSLIQGTALETAETPITILPLCADEEGLKDCVPYAIGTAKGVVKRVKPEVIPTDRSGNMHEVFQYIILGEGDSVIGGAPAGDDAELVFISTDASLLHYSAASVRPQGRVAGGMAGIRLDEGQNAIFFTALSHEVFTATDEPFEPLVFTVAGDAGALPNTQNGFGKLTPFNLYPGKGRATGGVRSQRFLKGQNALIYAWVGRGDARANTATGVAVELSEKDMRRDASGELLDHPITAMG
jgi:DNA gyrase subunit A